VVPEANSETEPAETIRLFVYGTLRSPVGGPPEDTHYHSRIAAHIVDSEPGLLRSAALYDRGAYPGIGAAEGTVRGEIMTLGSAALAEADVIEGHPDFYERRIETIERGDGSTVEAWVYWAPSSLIERCQRIPSGDWFERERTGGLTAPTELPADPLVEASFDRLASATNSWLSTVRLDGRPHAVAMWHVVLGNRIYFATTRDSVKVENISATPHVVVTLPDAEDVVIIDGWAIESRGLLDELAPRFMDKYDWDPRSDLEFEGDWTIIEVTPRVLRAWHDQHSHQRFTLD